MGDMDAKGGTKTEPVILTRIFPAPRELVFSAWSSADHVKKWFSPAGFTVPEAEIDFRPGGIFAVRMRSPEGQDFWSRGEYLEISPPARLVFATTMAIAGERKFTAHTTVTFAADETGTRVQVRQEYELFDPAFMAAIAGAPEGWRTTLDKLGTELKRMQAMPVRSVVHGMFTLERIYDASPAMVFRALSEKAAKARWFTGGAGYTLVERDMDVRPGGRERVVGRWDSGVVTEFDAVYYDVIENERLVYGYEMRHGGAKISVSLATMEITQAGAGTRLRVTEQGAFLDGYDDAGSREHGTGDLLDRLGASLAG